MADVRGPKWVQYVVDYTGLLAMVGVYVVTRDLLTAGWGLAGGSVVGLAIGLVVQRRLAMLPLVTGLSAILFAGLALVFHNTVFLKIKLTIVDGIFTAILLGGLALGKQPLRAVLGEAIKLSDQAWTKLTFRYGVFFAFLAIVNLIVWLNGTAISGLLAGMGVTMDSDAIWVAFRFPGVPVMALLFSATQMPLLMKELSAAEAAEEVVVPPVS